MQSRTLRPPHAIDLGRTLGLLRCGYRDPTIRISGQDVWRATRTPQGAATIHLSARGDAIDVEAWGAGAGWALEEAPLLVGFDDDTADFAPAHPLVRGLHAELDGLRFPKTLVVVEPLVPRILGQKVVEQEAKRSWNRLVTRLGEAAPGPAANLLLPPSPDALREAPVWVFHRAAIERKRSDTIRRVCQNAARLDAAVTPEQLQIIPGIGPWTAAGVAQVAWGDADAVVTGDYHLPDVVSYALTGERGGDDARMLELLEPFRGHRARVQRLIVLGAPKQHRTTLRAPLRDISTI